jgi:molybdopterin/thiamine biosynthesis adenylyltransferase
MDLYYTRLFKPYGRERPYASFIFNRNNQGDLVFSGRLFDRDLWLPVETLYTIGDKIDRQESSLWTKPKIAWVKGESFIERWENLVGPEVMERFAHTKVGIVGCSGTGSPAVEALARAQVGAFVVVDIQRVARSNLERIHGSTRSDVETLYPPYKVQLMERLIREINPAAAVTTMVGNILDDEVWGELLSCDIVLGCTDTYHGRAALGDLASLHLVPVIDVGVLPKGKNGQVTDQLIEITRMSPADPCPFCLGRIDPKALSVELMTEEEKDRCRLAAAEAEARGEDGTVYWPGEGPQLPSVGYLTTVAGALTAGYALNWLLGTSSMPHTRFQFDIGCPEFAFTTDTRAKNAGCSCARYVGWGDDGERSVTAPAISGLPSRLTSTLIRSRNSPLLQSLEK